MRIARRFNAGIPDIIIRVPKGRLIIDSLFGMFQPSLRDSLEMNASPGVKTPGYFQSFAAAALQSTTA
jgi:hypothetical protein